MYYDITGNLLKNKIKPNLLVVCFIYYFLIKPRKKIVNVIIHVSCTKNKILNNNFLYF